MILFLLLLVRYLAKINQRKKCSCWWFSRLRSHWNFNLSLWRLRYLQLQWRCEESYWLFSILFTILFIGFIPYRNRISNIRPIIDEGSTCFKALIKSRVRSLTRKRSSMSLPKLKVYLLWLRLSEWQPLSNSSKLASSWSSSRGSIFIGTT